MEPKEQMIQDIESGLGFSTDDTVDIIVALLFALDKDGYTSADTASIPLRAKHRHELEYGKRQMDTAFGGWTSGTMGKRPIEDIPGARPSVWDHPKEQESDG